jgi:large subunit ribosomal protein L17
MRHKRGNKKLGKPTDQRIALLRSLALSLIENSRIKTTDTRAKAAKRYVDRLITFAKKGTLSSRREALKLLPNPVAVKKLFDEFAEKYKNRNGGYTRVIKLGERRGDSALISLLELVE